MSVDIRVVYHSFSGNTAKLAQAVADALNVSSGAIETVSFSEPTDLLFIGDGIYFGKAHKSTIAFIERLTPDLVKNAAVFATYGGQKSIGTYIEGLLRNRGINVVGRPFICKGKAWGFINRGHPDENDLNLVRAFAKNTVTKVEAQAT